MSDYPRFHLAFPVTDLEATRKFYCNLLGCKTGRESDQWIDFDFFGHQVVAHLVAPEDHPAVKTNKVDGHAVPSSHFGPILEWQDFHDLAESLQAAKVSFIIEPYIRFENQPGEQATMFFQDPSGNSIEVKSFRDMGMLFAK